MWIRLICLFLIVVASTPFAMAQDLLRWKLGANDELKYHVAQTQKMKQQFGTNSQTTTVQQAMSMLWAVDSVSNNGLAKMQQRVERVRLKIDSGRGVVEFDTQEPAPPEDPLLAAMTSSLQKIVGKNFQVTMTNQGNVQDVVVPDDLLQALQTGVGANAGGINPETIKQMMKQSPITLPETAVQPGYKWASERSVDLGFGTMVIKSAMTYVKKDGSGNAVIAVVPEIKLVPKENQQLVVELKSSSGGGELLFNINQGRIVRSKLDTNMTMKVTMANGAISNQEIAQKLVMTLK